MAVNYDKASGDLNIYAAVTLFIVGGCGGQ